MLRLPVIALLALAFSLGACAAPAKLKAPPAPAAALPVTVASRGDAIVRILDITARHDNGRIRVDARMSRMKRLPLMKDRALLLEIVSADGQVRAAKHAKINPLRVAGRGTPESTVRIAFDAALAPGERLVASIATLPPAGGLPEAL